MKIEITSLKLSEFRRARREIEKYKRSLDRKLTKFIRLLADKGIETAKENAGEFSEYIRFSKQIEDGSTVYIVAKDRKKLLKTYMYKGRKKTVEVNATSMAEFGSGWESVIMDENADGYGQGTFPDQKHAFDPQGWFWVTPDGQKHHSFGEHPTFPLYSAAIAMIIEANKVAQEVFGDE